MCYSCLVFRFCKENSLDEKSLILFWLLKDAQLTCKRCPLSVQLSISCYAVSQLIDYKILAGVIKMLVFLCFSSF